ncbi:MAG: hypothetical protein ACLRWQ_03475 [Flavonifractor plautii]
MATSAIGPGFLTQTSKFTAQFGTALSLVIVLAIIMDITAQMNIWSVVSVSGMRAQDVANKLLPGLGVVIAILVAIGVWPSTWATWAAWPWASTPCSD